MPFSDEYFRLFESDPTFHDRVAQKYSLVSDGAKISERLLRCIWYDRLYDAERLATRDGKNIAVHSPGTWNLEAGPDFKRADISIGGRRLKGDIELHIDPAGWRHHHHSLDPRYDDVILHVTLIPRKKQAAALSRHGVEIPDVALWDYLADDLKVLKCALHPEEYPYGSMHNFGRCQGVLEQMPPEVALKLLCIAGDARMIAKQRRFAYETEKHDHDQVAYGGVLEGMGYKAHTKQFGELARKLSYARLRRRILSSGTTHPTSEKIRLTQALLLGGAGLLPPFDADDPVEARNYLGYLLQLWRDHGFDDLNDGNIEWKSAAVRPANLPERRIAGVSHVLVRSYEAGLFKSILTCVLRREAREARKGCVEYFTQAEDDFWSNRYSIKGKALSKPVALIGKDRALTIVVNSFVPLALLHARSQNSADDEELVHGLYRDLPSPQPNNITRLMEYRMFGASPGKRVARSARTQQGLLQIFADWCSEDPSCENCGMLTGLQSGHIGKSILDSGSP